jgi:FkbM family methyltransferase
MSDETAKQFWNDAANYYLLRTFNLNERIFAIDIGGYLGDWTAYLSNRYDCYLDVYEPVPEFYEKLEERFKGNDKVRCRNFGLGYPTRTEPIALMADSSTVYAPTREDAPIISIQDPAKFICEPDLLTINCEGGEYEILERLASGTNIKNIKYILVQFHDFFCDAEKNRNKVREMLNVTHKEDWCYPFVWEAWSARSA